MNCYHLEYLNQQEKENKREAKIKAKLAEIEDDEESFKIKDHRTKPKTPQIFAISREANKENVSTNRTKRRLLFDEDIEEKESNGYSSPIELKITKDKPASKCLHSKGKSIVFLLWVQLKIF